MKKRFTLADLQQSEAGKIPENQHLFEIPTPEEKKKSKYGNKKAEWQGQIFDSKRELNRYQILVMEEKSGLIRNLQRQVPFVLVEKQKGIRAMTYRADFVYERGPDWRQIVEDSKGFRTDAYRMKRKLMKDKFGIDILET